MLERELTGPVIAWLNGFGFTAYCEAPGVYSYRLTDVIAVHWETGTILSIELKTSLTKKVLRQALSAHCHSDIVYCAVGTAPRTSGVQLARKCGVGVLSVRAETITVVLDGEVRPIFNEERIRPKQLEYLRDMEPGGVAGLPGGFEAPAQECARRVIVYRQDHPRASWAEIFATVPNHYAHAKSMAGALRYMIPYVTRKDAKEAADGGDTPH